MACDLLTKWLTHYDPIHLGGTSRGIAHGVHAKAGQGFARIAGGYTLYRGIGDLSAMDYSDPVGAAGANATSIQNFSWRGHAAGTTYHYVLRAIGGGGVEETNDEVFAIATFDSGGAWVGPAANRPTNLRVEPTTGGTFRLRWAYDVPGQQAAPSVFRVYHDNPSGTVDYSTPIGTVTYRAGVADYSFETAAYAHDARILFSVRSESAGSVVERNTEVVMGVAVATGPVLHSTVLAECGQEWIHGCPVRSGP